MEFSTLKTTSFRPDEALLELINKVNADLGDKISPDFTMKQWIDTVLSNFVCPNDKNDLIETINSLEITIDEKEKEIVNKDHTIRQLQETANENARIAQNLQLQLDGIKDVTNENTLFSDENRFQFWQLLRLFQLQHPDMTFEGMILYVLSAYKNAGYLRPNSDDLKYLETIKKEYNGSLK